ncbi:cytochrome P450 [Ramaria rubella]|nr:cytochrome P450 [Ramaria rubella]
MLTVYEATPVALGIFVHQIFRTREPKANISTILFLISAPLVTWIISPHSWGNIWFHYLICYISCVLSTVSYRISPLHPLSSFPGPLHLRLTRFSGVPMSARGNQHLVLKELHDQYGPFVRIGPNELSICEAGAVKDVLGAEGLPKGVFYDTKRDPAAPANLIVLQGDEHARRRRIWDRGMGSEALAEYSELISKRALQLVDQLEHTSGSVNIAAWLSYFSFDFMGDMAFGGGFEMLRDSGDKFGLWKTVEDFMYVSSIVSHLPWLSPWISTLPFVSRSLRRLRKFGVESAMTRIESGTLRKDLWYHLTDEAGLEKVKPPISNVVADGALAIIGGADTAATALASLFFLLLSHPESMARARAEVDSVYPPADNALDVRMHGRLVFVEACLREALRLYPPVPTNGSRRVPSGSGGRIIAGRWIPEKTEIYLPPYSLHRDPRNFEDPNVFIPERWLRKGPTTAAGAFIPFSYGPANCAGRNLARQEMLMVASLLLQKFDFTIACPKDFTEQAWSSSLHDHFVFTRGKLRVHLSKRT